MEMHVYYNNISIIHSHKKYNYMRSCSLIQLYKCYFGNNFYRNAIDIYAFSDFPAKFRFPHRINSFGKHNYFLQANAQHMELLRRIKLNTFDLQLINVHTKNK